MMAFYGPGPHTHHDAHRSFISRNLVLFRKINILHLILPGNRPYRIMEFDVGDAAGRRAALVPAPGGSG
jgi:hypothetical protein